MGKCGRIQRAISNCVQRGEGVISPDSLKISLRNLFTKLFPKLPVSDAQIARCAQEWQGCASILDILSALNITRKAQRRIVVDEVDLTDVLIGYTTSILRNSGSLPEKPAWKQNYPTLEEIVAGGGYDEI
jgi:hypothetical protein